MKCEAEQLHEKRKTHAKFVYCKLCRMGKFAAAQRVLRLLHNRSLPFFNGDNDWDASHHLTMEKCLGNSISSNGNSERFWL